MTTADFTPSSLPRERRRRQPRGWGQWTLLVVFAFIALESLLLALTLQGRWWALLAPGLVCAAKAREQWRAMRRT